MDFGQPHTGGLRRRGSGLVLVAMLVIGLTMATAAPASATSYAAAAWGVNYRGQRGNGTTEESSVPVAVSGLSGVTAIAGGGESSLALAENGTVVGWGRRARAASAPCRSTTATIIRTEGVGGTVLDFSAQSPLGAPLRGSLLRSAGQGHFYQLSGLSATLRWGSNTYELSHGATVALGCYGQAKGANVFYPALSMLSGTATVLVSASDPGAVLTNEGLYGPIPGQQLHHGYTFRVTRALRAPAGHTGLLNWFANYANQPTGTSTIVTQDTSLVNVTPYVGPGRGHCRHVRKAILVSTGMQSVGAGQYVQTGTSQYSG